MPAAGWLRSSAWTMRLGRAPMRAKARPSPRQHLAVRAARWRSAPISQRRGIAAAEGGHMIMGQGAVPIIRNGVVEGACGVGGGTSQEDEDCARAGVEVLGK